MEEKKQIIDDNKEKGRTQKEESQKKESQTAKIDRNEEEKKDLIIDKEEEKTKKVVDWEEYEKLLAENQRLKKILKANNIDYNDNEGSNRKGS